jgi:hypothetical protein
MLSASLDLPALLHVIKDMSCYNMSMSTVNVPKVKTFEEP